MYYKQCAYYIRYTQTIRLQGPGIWDSLPNYPLGHDAAAALADVADAAPASGAAGRGQIGVRYALWHVARKRSHRPRKYSHAIKCCLRN